MPINHLIHYKPGLTMDTPVTVTMAAADWAIFMTQIVRIETPGLDHILYGVISPQVSEALYDQASVKAAQAFQHDQHEPYENPVSVLERIMGHLGTSPNPVENTKWIIECGECLSSDEYIPYHVGPLTCEHDGPRRVTGMITRTEGI